MNLPIPRVYSIKKNTIDMKVESEPNFDKTSGYVMNASRGPGCITSEIFSAPYSYFKYPSVANTQHPANKLVNVSIVVTILASI